MRVANFQMAVKYRTPKLNVFPSFLTGFPHVYCTIPARSVPVRVAVPGRPGRGPAAARARRRVCRCRETGVRIACGFCHVWSY